MGNKNSLLEPGLSMCGSPDVLAVSNAINTHGVIVLDTAVVSFRI